MSILLAIENFPNTQNQIVNYYIEPTKNQKHNTKSLQVHRKYAQGAWMAILKHDLSRAQRKAIVGKVPHNIAPCFLRIELLMDFLCDCINEGNAITLMALSGVFYLIQEKNLDYPQIYQKLYSLLKPNILNSKYRSRFFRLLDKFLESTHLPAALIASFIKRLSRLCLYSSPSAIVVVVPWIYNLLRSHPTCTFMIHREQPRNSAITSYEDKIRIDPFQMEESNPMQTNAEDSSLWEIRSLQSHYNANVAIIGKIISEQFTKISYNIEDFLDHSYNSVSFLPRSQLVPSQLKPPRCLTQNCLRIIGRHQSSSILYRRGF